MRRSWLRCRSGAGASGCNGLLVLIATLPCQVALQATLKLHSEHLTQLFVCAGNPISQNSTVTRQTMIAKKLSQPPVSPEHHLSPQTAVANMLSFKCATKVANRQSSS